MIKGIIFDWGGVIVDWTSDIVYRYISERFGIDFDYTKKKIEGGLLQKLQTGEIDEKEMWKRFFSSLDMDIPEDVEKLWSVNHKAKEQVMDIIKRLREMGYKLALLSNTISSHAAWGEENGTFQHFDQVICSCNVGLRKPDERIYKLALDKIELKAEECIFIDDVEKNLLPAEKLGIKTILFKNSKQLEEELSKVLGHD